MATEKRVPLTGDLKRGTPSRWPHELTIITDPDDSHYDEREKNEIKPEAVLNLAVVGQVQPVSVHMYGKRLILVDGLQRTKRALVINHLNGSHAYKGDLAAVKTCIEKLTGTDMAARIVEECPRAMKLAVVPFRGTEAAAYGAKGSANEFRDDDPIAFKAAKAQRMLRKWNYSAEEVSDQLGVSVATVKRWDKLDLTKPRPERKKRGKSTRPTRKKLGEALERAASKELKALLGWVLGKVTLADAAKHFPELETAE